MRAHLCVLVCSASELQPVTRNIIPIHLTLPLKRKVHFDDLIALDISQPQPLSRYLQGFRAPALQETPGKKILDFHIQMDWTG
jgi:hypothetical protein